MNRARVPARHMEKAQGSLRSAKILLDAGEIESACNRAYYAMYDAAHAALVATGHTDYKTIRTHRGLIAAFGSRLVQTNQLPRELGRLLNEVEQIRLLADYTGDEVKPEQAAWAVEQATVFVSAIRTMLAK